MTKQMVKFALMLDVLGHVDADGNGQNYGEHNWNFQAEEAVTQMQEPSYQTVLGGAWPVTGPVGGNQLKVRGLDKCNSSVGGTVYRMVTSDWAMPRARLQ